MNHRSPVADVVVAGAGIAGATLALILKRAMGDGLQVVLADPALATWRSWPQTFRALAVAPDARHYLEQLGIWAALADQTQPVRAMVITDSRVGATPNPAFLRFEDPGANALAHMVLADKLRALLVEACHNAGVALVAEPITDWTPGPYRVALTGSTRELPSTRLLVAADGGRSRLRHAARIQTLDRDYRQSGIVATLEHDEDHRGEAVQHFLPAGPIALLPLKAHDGSGRRTSIVWTEDGEVAEQLAALPPADFIGALELRIGRSLGVIRLEDRPRAHALKFSMARQLVGPRFALLGDAARTIHPLAGQGLNLGLRDAMALASHVLHHAEVGLDPGAPAVLEAYERDRRPASLAMGALTDSLNSLFSNDLLPLRSLRDVGLGLVDRAGPIKSFLVRQATIPAQPRI